MKTAKTAIELVVLERMRQIKEEGYSIEQDVELYSDNNDLEWAAAAYALPENLPMFFVENNVLRSDFFPWEKERWKPNPNDRIRELVKAAALLVAKIEVEQIKVSKTSKNVSENDTKVQENGIEMPENGIKFPISDSEKARKYEDLEKKIAKCYEDSGSDLVTIGEIAASHFGWL